jgi:hypothetical protein
VKPGCAGNARCGQPKGLANRNIPTKHCASAKGRHYLLEANMKKIHPVGVVHSSTSATEDTGKVRTGFLSPAFPPARSAPPNVADDGKVRTGFLSPAFPPKR